MQYALCKQWVFSARVKAETLRWDSMLLPIFSFPPGMSFNILWVEMFSGYFDTQVKFHLPRQILSHFPHFMFLQCFIHSFVIELPPVYCSIFCSCAVYLRSLAREQTWEGRVPERLRSIVFWSTPAPAWSPGLPLTAYLGCEPQLPMWKIGIIRDLRSC